MSSTKRRRGAGDGPPGPDTSPRFEGADPPGAWRDLRHDCSISFLSGRCARIWHVLPGRRHELGDSRGPVRDHRSRRLPAHDRRRVRPLGRLDDRLHRYRDRPIDHDVRGSAMALDPRGFRRGASDRGDQRNPHSSNRAALVHRHARGALHPARPDDLHPDLHQRVDDHRRPDNRGSA